MPAHTSDPTRRPSRNAWSTAARMATARLACSEGSPMTLYAAAIDPPIIDRSSFGSGVSAEAEAMRPESIDANTLPTIATPRVPPSSRVVSLTAEPTPALSGLSDPMIASVAGAVVSPRPVPSNTICIAITVYGVPASTVDAQASPAANTAKPALTTAVVPILWTTAGPITLASAIDTATGNSRTPA